MPEPPSLLGAPGPRKGIAVTLLCSEYGEGVRCGLYFVDYFLAPSDPASNEIPALHPSSGLGNQQLRSRAVRGQCSGIQSSCIRTEQPGLMGSKAGSRDRNMAE